LSNKAIEKKATKKEKRRRRKTLLKIQKQVATIKIAVQKCHAVKIRPAFESTHGEIDNRTIQRTAETIGSLIVIISENNPNTAAKVLEKVLELKSYSLVKNKFSEQYLPVHQKVVSGIKSFIAHHSNLPKGGSRQTDQQSVIDAVTLAAIWDLEVDEIIRSEVSNAIGLRVHKVTEYIHARAHMKRAGEHFKPRKRKMRINDIQEEAYTYIQKWQHNDQTT
jgi:hypothetical protein